MILETEAQQEAKVVESWPQTTQVFDAPKVNFDSHSWRQEGYMIYDTCSGCVSQAIPIPSGKMLIMEGGKYQIVDERRS